MVGGRNASGVVGLGRVMFGMMDWGQVAKSNQGQKYKSGDSMQSHGVYIDHVDRKPTTPA